MIWAETPTNPLLRIVDIAALAALKRPGLLLAVDNTFATPYFQRPIALGADLVIHSTTKYINGHSDIIGGAVISDDPEIHAQIAFYQNAAGAVPGPNDVFLTLRGCKTLALRMRQHEHNAGAIAHWLSERSDVGAVYYPGLPDHPEHELARRQMDGFGGIVSFRVLGNPRRGLEVVRSLRFFQLAVSLGGVESLVASPPSMSHAAIPATRKAELEITDDLIRLSVGIEEVEDLIADLAETLDRTAPHAPHQ